MEPFETIFLRLGVVVLKNAENFLAANPSQTVQEIKTELAELIKDIQASGNIANIKKLEFESKFKIHNSKFLSLRIEIIL